ncbi:MAG: ATP-binding cassette domain-containing protein, partial [Proteobacteria bacterium]|nr:ATP-binding cassette domain-containing protein [Pseudomonadota bacterium]
MSTPLLLSIQEAHVQFGTKTLFEDLSFNIHAGNKICLIGKNGAGKTTLMNVITGKQELDSGKRNEAPNLKIGHLIQETVFDPEQTVFDYIYQALPKEDQLEDNSYMVDIVAQPLDLDFKDKMGNLSGGQ